MPARKKNAVTYKLLFKPYDDVTYQDERSRAVLSLHSLNGKVLKSTDDLEREWGMVPTLKMTETDDSVENGPNCIFKDAEWSDFDQDFIKCMMDKPDDETTAVLDMDNYPVHDPKQATSVIDKAFAREMEEFDNTYDLEEGDERTKGPLDIAVYGAALDEWIEDHQHVSFLDEWKGSEKQVGEKTIVSTVPVPEVLCEHIFHRDPKGVYLTVLQNKKATNMYNEYFSQRKDAVALTKKIIEDDPNCGCAPAINEDEVLDELIPPKVEEPFDCQTIISTYSNLENHPELIREPPNPNRKIKLSNKTGMPKIVKQEKTQDDDDDDDDEDDLYERQSQLTSTVSHLRPKDETPEERKERKSLVKELKKIKREQKKNLKEAFKSESVNQRIGLQHSENQKRTLHLGLT